MQKSVIRVFVYVFLILFILPLAFAHEEEHKKDFISPEVLTKISLVLIGLTSANALILVSLSHFYKKKKKLVFLTLIIPIILTTLFLLISTIYMNLNAESSGPVHWHADYEIWACGEKLNLMDPDGLSNKIGTNLFHEHNDDRIHIEGVIDDMDKINLQHFIETVGGEISSSAISLMTNEGAVNYENGKQCNGFLQVFVYKTENERVIQNKVENFLDYIPSPYSQVPPGDCIIIEFAEEKESTEHICGTYRIAEEKGEAHGS